MTRTIDNSGDGAYRIDFACNDCGTVITVASWSAPAGWGKVAFSFPGSDGKNLIAEKDLCADCSAPVVAALGVASLVDDRQAAATRDAAQAEAETAERPSAARTAGRTAGRTGAKTVAKTPARKPAKSPAKDVGGASRPRRASSRQAERTEAGTPR